MTTSDPTPGDLDEFVAIGFDGGTTYALTGKNAGHWVEGAPTHVPVEDLQAEQSARQAAEANAVRWQKTWQRADESGEKHANGFLEERLAIQSERDAIQQRLTIAEAIISRAAYCTREEYPRDQVLAVLQNPLPPLTAPTESKESEPEGYVSRFRENPNSVGGFHEQ